MKRQHKIFADEIVKGTDPTAAYMKAYLNAKPTTARSESYRIQQIPTVAAYIKEKSEKINAKAEKKAVESLLIWLRTVNVT